MLEKAVIFAVDIVHILPNKVSASGTNTILDASSISVVGLQKI